MMHLSKIEAEYFSHLYFILVSTYYIVRNLVFICTPEKLEIFKKNYKLILKFVLEQIICVK